MRIIELAGGKLLFLEREVVVEPAVVDSPGTQAVLRLIKVLLLNIDFRDLEEGNDGDVTQFVHVNEAGEQVFHDRLGLIVEIFDLLGPRNGALVLDHLLKV